ncbi:SPFH domain, Band 7 family protein [Staphylothermus marinus F1]|uniref:SPFH domain, Band 7 family protein n=2 Tax=Staphylothermus marinus TaxID=2280 RepID=A3DKV9_STAMF|nr:SPFH domain, Band 7 family protein [Staphylothermus marinus F1]
MLPYPYIGLYFLGIEEMLPGIIFLVIILLIFLAMSIKIVREYERAVIFRLGRLLGAKGPGLFFIIPFVDNFIKVDLRVTTVDVPEQQIITKDNVTVGVDAVVYYRVFDPVLAVTRVENYHYAVMMMAQTTLRDIIGQVELDDLLSRREEINKRLQAILDEVTDPWGIKVTAVTLKQVRLPESMLRAMARQAEAERWRRAKIIEAEGEKQASIILGEAAKIYEQHPAALRLRELQTLLEIAKEKNLIIISPSTLGAETSLLGTAIALSRKTSGSGGSGE